MQPTPAHYRLEVRVVACDHCGAPLPASAAGGALACSYCQALNQVAARRELPTFTAPDPETLREPERLRRLEAQVAKPITTPLGLGAILDGGKIPPWRAQDAFVAWKSLRARAAAADHLAAEELVFLTLLIARGLDHDASRQRALLESTLEVLSLPRHRQVVLAALVRGAAREADFVAASSWLAYFDPALDDLEADSAYRIARSLVATMRGELGDVLHVLGGEVRFPIALQWRPLATLLRANAHLRCADRARAEAALLSSECSDLEPEFSRYRAILAPDLLDFARRSHRKAAACGSVLCTLVAVPCWIFVALFGSEPAKESAFWAILVGIAGILAALATLCLIILAFSLIFQGRGGRRAV